MADEKFDPRKHLIKTKGQKLYLPVAARILWMTTDREDGGYEITVDQEVVHYSEERAVVKTVLTVPGRGRATGIKSETKTGFPGNYLEKAACLPLRSQALTRNGFKHFDELVVGEDVLAYDVERDTCVWTPLLAVTVHPHLPMVRLSNEQGLSIDCTPDHSWAVRRRRCLKGHVRTIVHELQETQQFVGKHEISLLLAAPAPGGDSPLTPEEAAIIGWLFTDGSIERKGGFVRGRITQSRPEHLPGLRSLLSGLATERQEPARAGGTILGRSITPTDRPVSYFTLPAGITRSLLAKAGIEGADDLPGLATRLSQPARVAMLGAMMDADGSRRIVPGRTPRATFGKPRRPVMEAWQILATLEGIALGKLAPSDAQHACPHQQLKTRRWLNASVIRLESLGHQAAWCPTTRFGTWVMRQDNRVAITGNTGSLGRAAAVLGYGTEYALELWEEDVQEGGEVSAAVDTPRAAPARTEGHTVATNAGGVTLVQKAGTTLAATQTGTSAAADTRKVAANQEIKRLAREHGYSPPTSYGALVRLAQDQYGYKLPQVAGVHQIKPEVLEEFVAHMKHVGGDPATEGAAQKGEATTGPFEQAPQDAQDPAAVERYARAIADLRRALDAYTVPAQLDDVIALVRRLHAEGCVRAEDRMNLEEQHARRVREIEEAKAAKSA